MKPRIKSYKKSRKIRKSKKRFTRNRRIYGGQNATETPVNNAAEAARLKAAQEAGGDPLVNNAAAQGESPVNKAEAAAVKAEEAAVRAEVASKKAEASAVRAEELVKPKEPVAPITEEVVVEES